MKAWQNITIQILGTLVHVGNISAQLSGSGVFGSGKTPVIIAAATAVLQSIAGTVAHWYNPDGTSAQAPYVPASK